MPVAYSATLKTHRMNLVNDLVNSKSVQSSTGGGSAGNLIIGTSALAGGGTGVLATIPLQNPAFTESSGVLTLAGVPLSATASGAGTAAKAEIRNNAGVVIVSGLTVGAGSGDINLNSTAISIGQTVTVTSGTITHG